MTFEVGQFVSCPPYGIPMKVMAVTGDQVECFWLDAKRRPQTKTFHTDLLTPFKRPRPIVFRL